MDARGIERLGIHVLLAEIIHDPRVIAITGNARCSRKAVAARGERVGTRKWMKPTGRQNIDRCHFHQIAKGWHGRGRCRWWHVDQASDGGTIKRAKISIKNAAWRVLVGVRCASQVVDRPCYLSVRGKSRIRPRKCMATSRRVRRLSAYASRVTELVVDGLVRCGGTRASRRHNRRRWRCWWRRWRRGR